MSNFDYVTDDIEIQIIKIRQGSRKLKMNWSMYEIRPNESIVQVLNNDDKCPKCKNKVVYYYSPPERGNDYYTINSVKCSKCDWYVLTLYYDEQVPVERIVRIV